MADLYDDQSNKLLDGIFADRGDDIDQLPTADQSPGEVLADLPNGANQLNNAEQPQVIDPIYDDLFAATQLDVANQLQVENQQQPTDKVSIANVFGGVPAGQHRGANQVQKKTLQPQLDHPFDQLIAPYQHNTINQLRFTNPNQPIKQALNAQQLATGIPAEQYYLANQVQDTMQPQLDQPPAQLNVSYQTYATNQLQHTSQMPLMKIVAAHQVPHGVLAGQHHGANQVRISTQSRLNQPVVQLNAQYQPNAADPLQSAIQNLNNVFTAHQGLNDVLDGDNADQHEVNKAQAEEAKNKDPFAGAQWLLRGRTADEFHADMMSYVYNGPHTHKTTPEPMSKSQTKSTKANFDFEFGSGSMPSSNPASNPPAASFSGANPNFTFGSASTSKPASNSIATSFSGPNPNFAFGSTSMPRPTFASNPNSVFNRRSAHKPRSSSKPYSISRAISTFGPAPRNPPSQSSDQTRRPIAPPISSSMLGSTPQSKRLYFAYGSNLCREQMASRCPSAEIVGYANLYHYRFQINERGYANVVQETGGRVAGVVYSLTAEAEKRLDVAEGVPHCYKKIPKTIHLVRKAARRVSVQAPTATGMLQVRAPPEKVEALVYICLEYTQDDAPWKEYIDRMKRGISDGIEAGLEKDYFDKEVEPWLRISKEDKMVQETFGVVL